MISDATAYILAEDLIGARELYRAALEVIATQQRKIDALARANLALREELRERMGVRE
jgi:hypothetical protein